MPFDRVLVIDDDANLLAGLQRQLRKRFDVSVALGGEDGLRSVEGAELDNDSFAVVLCDMRMPGMDGIEVLRRIKAMAPDTVRMMLTGNADQQTAIDAINQGSIFRFFTKPCPTDALAEGLQAGIDQFHLITAERDLLEKTLAGSVRMLADVMSLNDPEACALAARLREWVRLLTVEFKLPQRWQLEIAAMLAPLGQLAIPPELMSKRRAGMRLSEAEQAVFERAPEVARTLISHIPRLSKVAEIVYLQDRGYDGSGFPQDGPVGADIPIDARLLRILKDLAVATRGDRPDTAAFAVLERRHQQYDPLLFGKIRTCLLAALPAPSSYETELTVRELRPGHLVLSNIKLANGFLVFAADTLLTEVQIERLRALQGIYEFSEPIRVRVL